MNYKKQLGLALNGIKSQQWFIEADVVLQDEVLASIKEQYTPPDNMGNVMLNGCMKQLGIFDKWVHHCKKLFPWADCLDGGGEVRLEKREFFSRSISI